MYVHIHVALTLTPHTAQEANEITEDSEGRWWPFKATNATMMILEKKNIASHLSGIESLDSPVSLQALMVDLQDCGEVGV